jgi:hypothetical protein
MPSRPAGNETPTSSRLETDRYPKAYIPDARVFTWPIGGSYGCRTMAIKEGFVLIYGTEGDLDW